MSTSKKFNLIDGVVTYGRIKESISFIISIIIAVILMIIAIFTFIANINKPPISYNGIIKSINSCDNTNCYVTVEYYDNKLKKNVTLNTIANLNVHTGDSFKINTGGEKSAYVLGGISLAIIIISILYYKYVMSNKYGAILNALPSFRYNY